MTSPLPYQPAPTAITPQQWAYLTPAQQWQHTSRYGPPPAWYPPSVYAQPMYQAGPAVAPVVNVAVAQAVAVGGHRHIAHGFHLLMTLLTGGLWGFVWLAIIITRR